MPITEIVRILATAQGRGGLKVGLLYDVDGRMGVDEATVGFPSFWLRVQGRSEGPFEHEGEALEAAWQRYGARF